MLGCREVTEQTFASFLDACEQSFFGLFSTACKFLHFQRSTFRSDLLYNVDIEAAFEGPLNQVSGLNWG